MADLFTFERVVLDKPALGQYPYLSGIVGEVQRHRRDPFMGRCAVVRFPVGKKTEWVYLPPTNFLSVEGQPVAPLTISALTVWQPYAILIAWLEKQWETRCWSTKYRGLVAIHAGQEKPKIPARDTFYGQQWHAVADKHTRLHPEYYLKHEAPLGKVLCIAKLVDCQPVEEIRDSLSFQERCFGDYSDGRYAFKLDVVEVLESPIDATGKQRFWHWTQPLPESISEKVQV